jgi:hypothetical protein
MWECNGESGWFDGFKCGVGVYPHETGVGLFH